MSGILKRTLKLCFVRSSVSEYLLCDLNRISKMPFYAVARGRRTGIYNSWAECEAQVKGFTVAKFKKFDTASSANDFIHSNSNTGGGYASNSSYNNYQRNPNNNLKRSYGTSSNNNDNSASTSSSWKSNSANSESSDDGLEVILNKKMDDLEQRIKAFSRGIDNIIKSSRRPGGETKKTILIEPPHKKYKCNDKTDFEEDNAGYVQVYTGGACSAYWKNGAQAGLGVYWGDDHHLNRSQAVSGRATNNCGDIQAATLAIKTAVQNGVKKLAINTDSRYLINAATKWMPGWKRRGWKLASGKAVKNEIDFKDLDSVLGEVDVKWTYVKAHNGKHGNEMADRLAKAGAAMYDSPNSSLY